MSMVLTRQMRRRAWTSEPFPRVAPQHEALMLRILSERAAHQEAGQPLSTLDRAIMKGWIYVSGLGRAARGED